MKGVRLQSKKVLEPAKDVTVDQLQAEMKAAFKKLDKAASKHVIHPNAAARRKSRLARLLNAKKKVAASAAPPA